MDHKIKSPIGLYGKLPAHGDFIERNLSREFIDAWDNWQQQSILSSQSQLNENWLNTYMVSPVWRFALSPGCLDQHPWIGITLPSVDSVGRYFPLTLAAKLPSNTPLFNALQSHQQWLEQIETIALACLNEQPNIDEVMAVLAEHPLYIEAKAYAQNNQTSAMQNHHQSHDLNELALDELALNKLNLNKSNLDELVLDAQNPLEVQDPLYESLIANSVDASQLDVATASAFGQQNTACNLDDTQTFDSQQLQQLIGLEQQNTDTPPQVETFEDSKHKNREGDSKHVHINQLYSNDWAVTEADTQQTSAHFEALGERMLDTLLAQKYPSYSIWQTKGSDIVKPSLLCSPFLPQPSYFFAMMGGYWEQAKTN